MPSPERSSSPTPHNPPIPTRSDKRRLFAAPASNAIVIANVTVNLTDNDPQSLVVTPAALSVNEGDTANFSVKLAKEPSANVVVNSARTAGDVDLSVSVGTNLTFTPANWNIAQAVILAAAQDPDAIDSPATITVTASRQFS